MLLMLMLNACIVLNISLLKCVISLLISDKQLFFALFFFVSLLVHISRTVRCYYHHFMFVVQFFCIWIACSLAFIYCLEVIEHFCAFIWFSIMFLLLWCTPIIPMCVWCVCRKACGCIMFAPSQLVCIGGLSNDYGQRGCLDTVWCQLILWTAWMLCWITTYLSTFHER